MTPFARRRRVRLGALASLLAVVAALVTLAAPAATTAPERYVALGDSFSSGVGTGSYTLSSACRRSVYAYPSLVAQQRPNTALTFVACSGATTSDLMATQIQSVTPDTAIVTVTIGGNDIGFADLIVQCTLGECSSRLDATRASLASALTPRLDAVYAAIRSRAAATAKIVVLGYPRMFASSGCIGTLGISATERGKANQLADALDQVIAARAAAQGLTYRSALGAFTGHAVCSWTPWLSGLNVFATVESYHPNRNGNSAGYAPLVRGAVG
jgi:lysophospholipase L1-like esterase